MNELALTKRERRYIQPALVYRQDLKYSSNGNWYWDGDEYSNPVSVGVVCEALVKKGLLVNTGYSFRQTELALKFICKNRDKDQIIVCYQGRMFNIDTDEDTGERCPECEGFGVICQIDKCCLG